jgi:multidrug resistance efflux pump
MYVRGAAIKQGQQLRRLNASEAQQRVNDRQTAATLAQRQFDRFQTLAGRQAISKRKWISSGPTATPPTPR